MRRTMFRLSGKNRWYRTRLTQIKGGYPSTKKDLYAMLGTPSGAEYGGWGDGRYLFYLLVGEAIVYHNLIAAP